MAHTVMTHDEFKAYLKLQDIELTKITETKVYLNFEIAGYASPTEAKKDRNILPTEKQEEQFIIRTDWEDGIGGSFKEHLVIGRKIQCIKMLRGHLGLGLKEAKDLYEKYEHIWRSYISEGGNNESGLSTVSR